MSRTLMALVGTALAWAVLSGVAVADLGAAIDLGRITVTEPVRPGTELDLPELTVRNPGDETGRYLVEVVDIEGGGVVDAAWGSFEPSTFELAPGARQLVDGTLTIPSDAAPGRYELLVRAAVSSPAGPDGIASIGGAAASRVTLVVADPSVLRALGRLLGSLLTEHLAWVLGTLAVTTAYLFGRRSRARSAT